MSTSNHAEISKSRSKKNPFKVRYVSESSEATASSETLATRRNAVKNILATMQIFGGESVDVCDKSGKTPKWFALGKDGLETPREPDEVS